MEAEKKRSKGGFLHLFDWNGKSRKKLFANNSEELPGIICVLKMRCFLVDTLFDYTF